MKKIKYILFSLIVLLALIFVYFITYTFVEPKAYDFMTKNVLTQRLPFDNKKNIYGSDDIVLVVIDANTIEKYRWPWKRDINCKIFNFFSEYAKPKVVVHDSVLVTLDKENPESDYKFFQSLSKIDNLVEGFMPRITEWENVDSGKVYDNMFTNKYALNVANNSNFISKLYSSVMPFPKPYFDIIKHVGSVALIPGFIDGNLSNYALDEVFRTHEYIINYNKALFPSLAMATYLQAHNNPKVTLENNKLRIGNLEINMNQTTFQMISPLKFYKMYDNGYSHIKYSAVDIMDSYDNIRQGKKTVIDPQKFKEKIVVIGANVPAGTGLNDNKNSPVSVNHPGVDMQATAIDNIMHNDFLKVIPKWFNIFIILLGMAFVYCTIRTHELFKAISYTILVIVLYLFIAATCFYYNVVINVITPPVMFVVTMIIAYVHRYLIESRNKEKVKNAMGKYMSEDVMKSVMKNIDNLGLGGKKSTVTVVFSDIRGFTSLSEKMSASQVSELLNEYFSEMEPIVTKYNGIINKFIGDAIMAVFGEPIQDEKHPLKAVKCGFEMLQKVKELDEKWEKEGKPKVEIGIGVNTGEVFVGNIGSVNRMEYTVIGDTVNLASRLESYNKMYKTHMLISSSTYEASKEIIEVNRISDVEIRGKSEKIDIYEVVGVGSLAE